MINISQETHPDLYSNHLKCVEFCKNIPDQSYNKLTDFHFLWKVGHPFGRKQALCIKSFLATQELSYKTLNLWSNIDLSKNKFIKPLLPYINLRIWDPIKEAKGTPIESRTFLLEAEDNQCWIDGDLFRALVLYNYGGVYSDVDVVFLRDFGPLLEQEFAYTWGLEPNEISGGMIRLFKNSKVNNSILEAILREDIFRDSTHGSFNFTLPRTTIQGVLSENLRDGKSGCTLEIDLSQEQLKEGLASINGSNTADWSNGIYPAVKKKNPDWTIFPCGFFNTEWGISEEELEKDKEYRKFVQFPYKKTKYSNTLYEGVFSWHWHSNWKARISKGSKWQILEEQTEKLFKEKFKLI